MAELGFVLGLRDLVLVAARWIIRLRREIAIAQM